MTKAPQPTPVYRLIHIDNLDVCNQWYEPQGKPWTQDSVTSHGESNHYGSSAVVAPLARRRRIKRKGFHAPNFTPQNGLSYKPIHDVEIQNTRHARSIPCGKKGVIHDYISFYFGPRSPMLFQLHTDQVVGYEEGQEPLIYVVSTAQTIQQAGLDCVFSDGHGIAAYTSWFVNLNELDKIDWKTVYADYWASDTNDMDRQRRKQAEFLVHQFCPWSVLQKICVLNQNMCERVKSILNQLNISMHVTIEPKWYY